MAFARQFVRKTHRTTLVLRKITEDRLNNTCFRGKSRNIGGNFKRWQSAEELFRERVILDDLLQEIDEMFARGETGTHSVNIDYGFPVGWSSTDKLENYKEEDLEGFKPNRRSTALRVRLDLKNLLAPITNTLTIVYEFRDEYGEPVAVIHSMYPGEDVGDLTDDVTEREKLVFFDWNHPGA